MRRSLVVALGLASALAMDAVQEDAVGWRFEVVSDSSRIYEPDPGDRSGPGARPVAITIFYPAGSSPAPPSDYAAFARLSAYDRYREPPPDTEDEAAAAALKDAAPDVRHRSTRSLREAKPRTGAHPLVLFAHSTPLGMVAMSEHLASQGFVVAGVISREAERGAYRLSVPDVQAMGDDLRFAFVHVSRLPFVDGSRVGVIGMSNGALGAVALANTTRVQAIVSLDGTLGERAAARVVPELRSGAAPASVPPLLHLFAPENSYLDFATLAKWPANCFAVRIPEVGHSDFLTFALLRPEDPAATPRRTRVPEKFASMLRLTREFLAGRLTSTSATPRLAAADTGLGLTGAACSGH